ncbi:phage NrS-1 polymerase family protein, partial [Ezakiella coagulans]|uniref:phage NrS-1 polymerase family protein n=1 Tax=Ezakiella coagulans TaxID=46507 RepID=UPI0040592780
MQYDLIPENLKKLNRWGVYRLEEVDGRVTKVPYQPIPGNQKARVNDINTWYSFDEALKAVEAFDGLSLLLGDGIFGVDLDHVEEDLEKFECGEPEGIVYEFVCTLNSYAEISPSGSGVHIICGGHLPNGGRRKGNVEMYDNSRFFTITGDCIYEKDIMDCTETIKPLHEKYIGKAGKNVEMLARADEVTGETAKRGDSIIQSMQTDDLFRGNYEKLGYTSHSEADLALCNKLAYKCQWDINLMDYVFRQSGLYREKWDRNDYANATLSKAMDSKPEKLPKINIKTRYGYDDTGNAERFRDLFIGDVYYCPDFKKWTYYDPNKNKWCLDQMIVVKRMFDRVIEKMTDEGTSDPEALKKHIKATRSSVKKKNALTEAQHLIPVKA